LIRAPLVLLKGIQCNNLLLVHVIGRLRLTTVELYVDSLVAVKAIKMNMVGSPVGRIVMRI
jgi:membrane-bound acyltransferase YfiQ involved in biofilm formation